MASTATITTPVTRLDEAVEQITRTTVLPDDAAEVTKNCVAGAGEGWFDGWIVAWWMESPMPIEARSVSGATPCRPRRAGMRSSWPTRTGSDGS
jgi:hypothetical protein